MFVGSGGMSMHVYMDTLCPHIGFHVLHVWICVCYQGPVSLFWFVVCGLQNILLLSQFMTFILFKNL